HPPTRKGSDTLPGANAARAFSLALPCPVSDPVPVATAATPASTVRAVARTPCASAPTTPAETRASHSRTLLFLFPRPFLRRRPWRPLEAQQSRRFGAEVAEFFVSRLVFLHPLDGLVVPFPG